MYELEYDKARGIMRERGKLGAAFGASKKYKEQKARLMRSGSPVREGCQRREEAQKK